MWREKKKRDPFDLFFDDSLFDRIFEEFEEGSSLQSGYSIRVTQGPSGTEVHAKVGKDVDVTALRRELERQYPNAKIYIEGGQPLIREVPPNELKEESKGSPNKKKGVWFKPE